MYSKKLDDKFKVVFNEFENTCKLLKDNGKINENELITILNNKEKKEGVALAVTINEVARDEYNNIIKCIGSIFESEIEKDKDFVEKQINTWESMLQGMELMYKLSIEIAEKYGRILDKKDDEEKDSYKYRFVFLRDIHARALQIYAEIKWLIIGGYADGAFARWRTLYELSILSCFISESTEELAKIAYNSQDKYYNFNYLKNANCFSEKKYQSRKYNITLKDIKKNCSLNDNEKWDNHYKLSSNVVHASLSGTFGRIGTAGNEQVLTVGRTNYGSGLAGEAATLSLQLINNSYFLLVSDSNILVDIKVLLLISNQTIEFCNRINDSFDDNSYVFD